jgi:hypothetical protein
MLAEVNLGDAEEVNLQEFEVMWKNKTSDEVRSRRRRVWKNPMYGLLG